MLEQRAGDVRADLAAACHDRRTSDAAPPRPAATRMRAPRRSAPTIASRSGRSCAARARRRTRRAPGSSTRTTTHGMPKRFCATWPMTMFVLSPSSRRRPRRRPRCRPRAGARRPSRGRRRSRRPALAEPRERLLLLVDGGHVPAVLGQLQATAEPTRPQPITTPSRLMSVSRSPSSQHALREGDDQHLARRLAEHVVDGRREEARLAAPARRGAEDDQVGAALAACSTIAAPIERARTVTASTRTPCSSPSSTRLGERRGRAAPRSASGGVERLSSGTRSRRAPRPGPRAPSRA